PAELRLRRPSLDLPALRPVARLRPPAGRVQQLRLRGPGRPRCTLRGAVGERGAAGMSERITVGGHVRVRPFNTADTYPEQRLGNDLSQAVIAGSTIYLRGQVAQDLDTRENVAVGDAAGQAAKVMDNIELLLGECGAALEHVVSCHVYLTDIR